MRWSNFEKEMANMIRGRRRIHLLREGPMKLCLCWVEGDTSSKGYVVTPQHIFHVNDVQNSENSKCIRIDSAFCYYLIKELLLSDYYRKQFVYHWNNNQGKHLNLLLTPTKHDLIDYKWNERIYEMVRERCEVDHTLSWLSTLGGGFSALGDYFINCAEIAGRISFHQLQLGLRLGDPNITARCRLYFSLSLIQREKFRFAKSIIYREYHVAKEATVVDQRLLNMCKGIWAKLQYEYHQNSKRKNL